MNRRNLLLGSAAAVASIAPPTVAVAGDWLGYAPPDAAIRTAPPRPGEALTIREMRRHVRLDHYMKAAGAGKALG